LIFVSKIIVESKVNSGYQKLIDIKNTRDERIITDLVRQSIDDFRLASTLFHPYSFVPSEKIEIPNHIIN
jgi:hypothetical protein